MIYTIGHSTRSYEDFVNLLKKFGIEIVVDVRRFPSSKKFPWFNKEFLEENLAKDGIAYVHYASLGGFRKEGYANFAKTEEFKQEVAKLVKKFENKNIAIMCAEIIPFKCHRRYIAHELVMQGHKVIHIINENKVIEHKLTDEIKKRMKRKIRCD